MTRPTARSTGWAGTDGQLVNPRSGQCLDVPAASAANGTRPVIEPCASSAGPTGEHWFRPAAAIASGAPGRCIAASGPAAVLAACRNTAAQHWQPQPDGTIRQNGKCLLEGGTTARSPVLVGSCSGAAARWKLVSAGPVATELVAAASGRCASIAPNGARPLVIAACSRAPATTWHLG